MTTNVPSLSASLWGATMGEPNWDAVYAENFPKVYNFLRYRLRNEALAEDICNCEPQIVEEISRCARLR